MFLTYLDDDMKTAHAYYDESHVRHVDAFMMAVSAGVTPQGFCPDKCEEGLNEMKERGEWYDAY